MQIQSFSEKLEFSDTRIVTNIILETPFSKEVRILFKSGQTMKEHKTSFSIIVHVLEGEIEFGVEGVVYSLKKGAIISLQGNIKHDLHAKEDSVVRLTLSKLDKIERVENIVSNG